MRMFHFKSRRRNPFKGRSRRHHGGGRKRFRHNPSRHRRFRRNPGVNFKAIMAPSNFMQIGSVAVGFVAGAKVGGMIYNKLFEGTGALAKVRRFAGLVTFVLGGAVSALIKNDLARKAGMGIAVAGVYDLIAQNAPGAGLKPVNGDTVDIAGGNRVDLVGDGAYAQDDDMDGDTINVSGDMTDLVGDDAEADRIYA